VPLPRRARRPAPRPMGRSGSGSAFTPARRS
jgi:hypothetical protein